MGKLLYFFFYKLRGWKLKDNAPVHINHAVIVMGPHTSNWDFIMGRIGFAKYGLNGKFLIKSSLFFFPLGAFLRALGGIPINRGKHNNFTEQAANLFKENKKLHLVFTPEGTRSYNDNWKKGFYYIALKAQVPIFIGFLDYEKKLGGFHCLFEPTGNVDADIIEIKKMLSNYKGKFPEKGINDPTI
jgi:1-acyl-sn-glycerol-3-phosphate acyltransferase